MNKDDLERFVRESNKIEDIHRTTKEHIAAHKKLIGLATVSVADLEEFVTANQPDAILRKHPNLNVRVGSHIAPRGGPEIVSALEDILSDIGILHPHEIHVAYENLHPFTDGNGRSGRALWLWHMLKSGGRNRLMAEQLGFLHTFYYQTLDRSQSRLNNG